MTRGNTRKFEETPYTKKNPTHTGPLPQPLCPPPLPSTHTRRKIHQQLFRFGMIFADFECGLKTLLCSWQAPQIEMTPPRHNDRLRFRIKIILCLVCVCVCVRERERMYVCMSSAIAVAHQSLFVSGVFVCVCVCACVCVCV